MEPSRYRVIQWATGNTGQRALREVVRHPSLDLVGVRVYDSAKDGVDAGALCGEEPTGVLATTDRDAVLKVEADCCVYMPRATGRGKPGPVSPRTSSSTTSWRSSHRARTSSPHAAICSREGCG